jgi:predicted metal-dependent hydrolase
VANESHDPRYLEFFDRFNRQEYFEAHEVLEDLWLATHDDRRDFYKGLIQTAAVFLKLKEGKPDPAARLAARALALLERYEPRFRGLDVRTVTHLLRSQTVDTPAPRLRLEASCD